MFSDSLRDEAQPDWGPAVRTLARKLAVIGTAGGRPGLDAAQLDLSRLTAGLDPDASGTSSADFRFGAAEALATVYNTLLEGTVSKSTDEMLRKRHRPRVLAAIAGTPGLSQRVLAAQLGIRESNLTGMVQELSGAGLIEPALPLEGRGKAWAVSPWGARTLLSLIGGPFGEMLDAQETASAIEGARRVGGEQLAIPGGARATITKREVYERLEDALGRESDQPLQLTTMMVGDLSQHVRPWRLHKRAFEEGLKRPVEWVFVKDPANEAWLAELLGQAAGNDKLSVWTCPRPSEPQPTVQVLDDGGLLYPLPPDDTALLQGFDVARESWEQVRQTGTLAFESGSPIAV